MPRPVTARQAQQNAAFLAALARTGNARLAARELAVHRATYTKRRARDPAFAAAWDQAIAAAQVGIAKSHEPARPERSRGAPAPTSPTRTKGGELTLTRLANGRVQLRRAPPGRMLPAAEQAFLLALSASANIRLAAAAAGFAHSSFYARRRASRVFAREMRAALALGHERVKLALLTAELPGSAAAAGWRGNDPPAIPTMTAAQALQLLHLHGKTIELSWDAPHRRRRRGESDETYRLRLMTMWAAEKRMEADEAAVRRALSDDQILPGTGRGTAAGGGGVPTLPALDQITGWSKATGKPPHNPDLALFGGWRIADWKKGQSGA